MSAGIQEGMPLMLPGMPEAPERAPGDDRSRRRSWTARARQMVAVGMHPLTRRPARPELGTCGDCAHRVFAGRGARAFPKCELGPVTRGEQTDVRAWWPACHRWEPGHGGHNSSPDAARFMPEHADR